MRRPLGVHKWQGSIGKPLRGYNKESKLIFSDLRVERKYGETSASVREGRDDCYLALFGLERRIISFWGRAGGRGRGGRYGMWSNTKKMGVCL